MLFFRPKRFSIFFSRNFNLGDRKGVAWRSIFTHSPAISGTFLIPSACETSKKWPGRVCIKQNQPAVLVEPALARSGRRAGWSSAQAARGVRPQPPPTINTVIKLSTKTGTSDFAGRLLFDVLLTLLLHPPPTHPHPLLPQHPHPTPPPTPARQVGNGTPILMLGRRFASLSWDRRGLGGGVGGGILDGREDE